VALNIRWSPEAVEDLESIAEYIGKDSQYYAKAVVNKILNSTQNLGAFPYIGRMVPEISNENIRERFVYSYRLIYKIEEIEILIVAVIHGKRLLENIPNRFN
jgi:toxin ParE1/3/4